MSKKLVSVYGSLRKGLHNHHIIEKGEYLGEFKTEPIFNLYELYSYPGLKTGGDTSVTMEVYAVDDNTARNVDMLEGYREGGTNTFYDKIELETPFGMSSVYIYVPNVSEERKVESGDWKQHYTSKRTVNSW